jgi:hypothetical protein
MNIHERVSEINILSWVVLANIQPAKVCSDENAQKRDQTTTRRISPLSFSFFIF